ncbi:MAG: cytochrome b/b6 domain-containing protein [Burkholderiales bacterium]|jgi:cytochrome b|nr:cytochrome b/b6 domain-containing protein [Burkholderiales bacterium]
MRAEPRFAEHRPAVAGGLVRVWDLPTRLFHWSLAALVLFSIVTVKLGGLWIDWHMRSGYAILALVLFRVLWGFAGSHYARFASFVRGPVGMLGYLRGRVAHVAGHNPLGALSVVALLAVLGVQASTGLFTSDGSFTEGPLAKLVSGQTVDWLSTVHRYGEWVIYGLVGLHIAAVIFYSVFRFQPLVKAMLTGDRADVQARSAEDGGAVRLRALVLALLSALLITYLVTL